MASSKEIQSSVIKKFIKRIFSILGYEIKRINNFMDRHQNSIVEASKEELEQINSLRDKSLATAPNLWSIIQSIRYIKDNQIEGDLVECGVYNGFTLSLIGKLVSKNKLNKKIWGYDTFGEGFIIENYTEYDLSPKNEKQNFEPDNHKYPTLLDVKKNINFLDNYDENKYKLIKGDIIKTLDIKDNIPEKISFLRMDTDIYSTTLKQLEVLYPKLSLGGVLLIDDYGLAPGVRKAVDEFFLEKKIWFHRVDMTCRLLIKS